MSDPFENHIVGFPTRRLNYDLDDNSQYINELLHEKIQFFNVKPRMMIIDIFDFNSK